MAYSLDLAALHDCRVWEGSVLRFDLNAVGKVFQLLLVYHHVAAFQTGLMPGDFC